MTLNNQTSNGNLYKWIINAPLGNDFKVKLPLDRGKYKIGLRHIFVKSKHVTGDVFNICIMDPHIDALTYGHEEGLLNIIGAFSINKLIVEKDYTGITQFHNIDFTWNNVLSIKIINNKSTCLDAVCILIFDMFQSNNYM